MTLSVATSGFLPSLTPECIATQGFICGEIAELTGGVKAKIYHEDVEPLWKQKEYEPDWIDLEIAKELKKLPQHKPDILEIEAKGVYSTDEVKKRLKKKRRNKAIAMLLRSL